MSDADEVPDSEEEREGASIGFKNLSSTIGAFTTPSLPSKSAAFVGLDTESVSDFTTPNRSNLQDMGQQDRIAPTDISNFTATGSVHGTADVADATEPHNILPASLLSPHALTSDQSPPLNLKTPKPRPKPRYTNNSASASSPPRASLLYSAISSSPNSHYKNIPGSPGAVGPSITDSRARPADLTVPDTINTKAPSPIAGDIIDISSGDDDIAKPRKRKRTPLTDDESDGAVDIPPKSKPSRQIKDDLESDPEFDPLAAKPTKSKSKSKPRRVSGQSASKLVHSMDLPDELDVIQRPPGSSASANKSPAQKVNRVRKRKTKEDAEFKSAEFIVTDDEDDGPTPKAQSSTSRNRNIIAEVILPTYRQSITTHSLPLAIPTPAPTTSVVTPALDLSSPPHSPAPIAPSSRAKKRKSSSRKIPASALSDDDEGPLVSSRKRGRVSDPDDDDAFNPFTPSIDRQDGVLKPSEPPEKAKKSRKSRAKAPKAIDRLTPNEELDEAQDLDLRGAKDTPESVLHNAGDEPKPAAKKKRKSAGKQKGARKDVSEGEANDDDAFASLEDIQKLTPGNADAIEEAQQIPDEASPPVTKRKNARVSKAKMMASDEDDHLVAKKSPTPTPPEPSPTEQSAPTLKALDRSVSSKPLEKKIQPQASPPQFDKPREALTISEILLKTGLAASSSTSKHRKLGLSKTHRIAPLHVFRRTPPPPPPPIPKTKKPKKKGEESDGDYDSEEEYELEGLTEKEKRKRREEKRNRMLYSP